MRRRPLLHSLAALTFVPRPGGAQAPTAPTRVLRVGPGASIGSLAEAARLARPGDRVEVQAGDYPGDVAQWTQDGLQLVAVGGPVRLRAAGRAAAGKGLFVIAGENVLVEGFEFSAAQVADGNGAGVRFERGSLHLRRCRFVDCEMGVLSNNDADARLHLEDCELAQARPGGGYSHLLYAGRIAELRLSGCWLHGGRRGHLLKSRAALNRVEYCRLIDDPRGEASYELEFPEGGDTLLLGNLIGQSLHSDNRLMLAYGTDGYPDGRTHALDLLHNTWINRLPWPGPLLRVRPGPLRLRAANNLILGPGGLALEPGWDLGGNHRASLLAGALDPALRLPPGHALSGQAVALPDGLAPPRRQYVHPAHSVALAGPALDPGALQQN